MNVLIVVATKQEIISEKVLEHPTLYTGVGMVNTAVSLTKKLLENNYSLVINMGIAGSFNDLIKVGDVVEVTEDIFSEIGFENGDYFSEFTDFNIKNSYKNVAKTNLKKVKGITVNTVHGHKQSIVEVKNRLSPDIESMEGAVIFKVCDDFNTPCIQIRSISNKVERRNKESWDIEMAIRNLNINVENILNKL